MKIYNKDWHELDLGSILSYLPATELLALQEYDNVMWRHRLIVINKVTQQVESILFKDLVIWEIKR